MAPTIEGVAPGSAPQAPTGFTTRRRLALPLLSAACLFLPALTSNEYYVHSVLSKVCIYAILVAGLDLVVGYSGDVSVGHAGLFAAGAYTTAILMVRWHTPFPAAALAGIAMAALFGFLLGIPALRLSGPYLAVATIAFGLIVQTFVNEAVDLTNGSQGIRDLPALRYGRLDFEGNHLFYLVYPLMLLSLLAVARLAASHWGRAFEALRESTVAAECSGISRFRYKLGAFILSAAFAGLAGALFVHIDKYIGPPTFSLQLSILFLIAVIFGGTRSVLGNVIGTFLVVVFPDVFSSLADYQLMIFGLLLIGTLYFMPQGIAGLVRTLTAGLGGGLRRRAEKVPERAAEGTAGSSRAASPGATEAMGLGSPLLADAAFPAPRAFPAAPGEQPLLATRDLTIAFGGLVAVDRLSLTLRAGRVHALIGPNGSGKSTTVNLLSGIYRPTSGEILFAGREIGRAAPHRISRLGIARTFQNVALFGEMSVVENVLIGLHHSFAGGLPDVLLGTGRARREERQARQRALALLEFVGLGGHAAERARSLPYGRQRLLEIARALAQDPCLILLDEPAAGLTSAEIAAVDELIVNLRRRGLGILLIEHHMDLVMSVSDEVTVLDFGQQIAHGTPEEVQRDTRVIGAYLGTEGHGGRPAAMDGQASPEAPAGA